MLNEYFFISGIFVLELIVFLLMLKCDILLTFCLRNEKITGRSISVEINDHERKFMSASCFNNFNGC